MIQLNTSFSQKLPNLQLAWYNYMTIDEAKKMARVVETAEGGCKGCMNEAIQELNKEFPDFIFTLETHYSGAFDPSILVTLRPKFVPPPLYRSIRC